MEPVKNPTHENINYIDLCGYKLYCPNCNHNISNLFHTYENPMGLYVDKPIKYWQVNTFFSNCVKCLALINFVYNQPAIFKPLDDYAQIVILNKDDD